MYKIISLTKKLLASQFYAMSLYARQIAGTIVLLFVSRFLSVYDYGLFRSYGTIATFGLMFANLDYANYILVSSKANVHDVKLKISLFISNAILLLLVILLLSFSFNLENSLIFVLVLLRTFFDSTFFGLMLPYYQAAKKFNLISWINIFYSVMTIIFTLICYIKHYNLVTFLIFGITLGLFNFIQCSYFAKIDYLLYFKHIKNIIQRIDKSIWAYIGGSVAYFLYAQIPPLYVSLTIPKEKAALFFAAYTIANIAFILVNAQNQKLVPELIKCDTNQCKRVLNNNCIFILSILFTIILVFSLFGKFIMKMIYGQEVYGDANLILIILTLGNIFVALGAIHGAYITAKGLQKYKPRFMLEASVVTGISLLLLHKFGIYGAALSFLFAAIYAGGRFTSFTRQELNRQYYNKTVRGDI